MEVPLDDAFDGSPTWKVVRYLKDGSALNVRPITPDDREDLRRAFLEMSPTTRYLRFLGIASELTEEMLTYLTEVDQKNHVALVATMISPDLKTERGVGIGRLIRLAENSEIAEAAITVTDAMQRQGVGSALAVELARAARFMGIHVIRAEVFEGNEAMRALLEAAGATRVEPRTGAGTLSYDIALAPMRDTPRAIIDLLRGAATTMAMSLRKLVPHDE